MMDIASYPRDLDAATGCYWGPEAVLLVPPCKHYRHGPTIYVGHLEADMWLSRDSDEPDAWAVLHCPPIRWMPLPALRSFSEVGRVEPTETLPDGTCEP